MSLILDGQIACVIAGIVGSFTSLPEEFAVVYCICSSQKWYYGTFNYYEENDSTISKRRDFDLLLRKTMVLNWNLWEIDLLWNTYDTSPNNLNYSVIW